MERLGVILSRFRFPIRSNWKAILLSVLAATTFWLFQSLNKNYSTNISYPITFDFPRKNYTAMEELPHKVELNVSGIGWNIFRKTFSIGLNPIHIRLDNPAKTSHLLGSALLAKINDHLTEFQVNYVISDTLFLDIERKISRKFGVYLDSMSIDIRDNFRISSPVAINVDSMTVSGPASLVNNLPKSIPLLINDKNIDESYSRSVEVEIGKYNHSLLTYDLEDIHVVFDVQEFVKVSSQVKLTKITNVTKVYALDSMIKVHYAIAQYDQAKVSKDSIRIVALPETLNKEDSTIELSVVDYPKEIFDIYLDTTSLKVIYE